MELKNTWRENSKSIARGAAEPMRHTNVVEKNAEEVSRRVAFHSDAL